jgi:hypothetical protein
LGESELSSNDNFFTMGAYSITAMKIVSLCGTVGLTVGNISIAKTKAIEKLAAVVKRVQVEQKLPEYKVLLMLSFTSV